jgi:hypothetical protein
MLLLRRRRLLARRLVKEVFPLLVLGLLDGSLLEKARAEHLVPPVLLYLGRDSLLGGWHGVQRQGSYSDPRPLLCIRLSTMKEVLDAKSTMAEDARLGRARRHVTSIAQRMSGRIALHSLDVQSADGVSVGFEVAAEGLCVSCAE